MQKLLAPVCVLALAAAAAAQTGRTMNLLAPAFLGQTASFEMTHPTGAAGNIYAFLYSLPFPGSTPITVPGFTVNGSALVDPINFVFDVLSARLRELAFLNPGVTIRFVD